jgi:uncharacterized phiE125 gp8 family phage protein
MGSLLVTAPTSEPVRLADLQMHLRIDGTDADPALVNYLRASRMFVENATRRVLVTQTWDATFDEWPSVINLPLQPVQSVTSITYVDESGATQTLGADQYALRRSGPENLAYIERAYGVAWPATRCQTDAITVRYVAGYGLPAAVPEPLKTAILFHAEMLYDRKPEDADLLASTRDALMSGYRVVRL